ATQVTTSGLALTGITGSNASVPSDYSLGTASASVAATITPLALTGVSLVGTVTKTYDGTNTVSNLTPSNYSVTGFVAGEGASTNVTTGTYDNGPSVAANPPGSPVTSSVLGAANYTANAGTSLSDYDLSAVTGVSAQGNIGSITNPVSPSTTSLIPDSVLASLYSGKDQLPPPTVSGPTDGWGPVPGMPSSLPGVQPNRQTAGGGPAAGTAGVGGQAQGEESKRGAPITNGAVRDLVIIINGGVNMSKRQGRRMRVLYSG
ncbi:MAG TPA: hypothetical protein VEF92_05075, partial [Burkholderiales bacterium]|nr:hypothetical protein [Burkholderiales bacterium]